MFSNLDLLFASTPLEGPEQMALDEVLLDVVSRPLCRVYAWKSPWVTFGYFQKYNLVKSLYPNRSLVRRWSGGGCVEHGEDFTFSLVVPESEPIVKESSSLFYRMLHEAIVNTLQQHQINARLANGEDQRSGASCFIAPSPCDVMLDQKKIVGGAQRRTKKRLLYQGSINLGGENGTIGTGEQFFLSLAKRLSPEVFLKNEEEESWIDEARALASQRYCLVSWLEKR